MFKEYAYLKLDQESAERSRHSVVEEVPLSVFVNGKHFITAMISPSMINEFVIGHFLSEGIINNLEDIESMEIQADVARLIIKNPLKIISSRRLIVSGCGGCASYLDESRLPKILSDFRVPKENIFWAINYISSSILHQATGGVHSVGLFDHNGPICIAEDIGRHNALDKVIGFGLIKKISFAETYLASTGRISSEMALKCSMAGIPIIASRGATTSLAIEIAKRTGLTVAGFVRGRQMNIYTERQRIY
ncbi:MAG: formate dehydrogenase accessory sulfurtransferase FdhD [Methanotrichaceae archaeon]|nr:formate dehydrogenase accessory sulfurtransferase FdhD [Methanotrichaceae archaeon]